MHAYTIGIEEEYFIVSKISGDIHVSANKSFFDAAKTALPLIVSTELLQSQIEVATPPSDSMEDLHAMLSAYRLDLHAIGARYDLSLIASGTHPTATWTEQRSTVAPRYDQVMRDLQMLGYRNMLCGMHVHVSPADSSRRIEIMRRLLPFVPMLLALSTSSPFWRSQRTGLMGYRLAAYQELPRTGLPDLFADEEEFGSYVEALTKAGAIADSSYLWWVIRPSLKHGTLELRVADACTRVEDTVAIATLYRCLVRLLERRADIHARMNGADRAIIAENLWRAQRYGIHGSLIDLARGGAMSVCDMVSKTLDLVQDDAKALGCTEALNDVVAILERGTSADQQIALYSQARARGRGRKEALADVVGWLGQTTATRELLPMQ
jgi:glutamate---cysteine ligase / carboxylate-amine ligase